MTTSPNYVPERELLVTARTHWGRQWRHACGQLQGNDTDVLPPVSRSCLFRGNHLQLYANSYFPSEQADTFLCSTEVVQSVIHNPKATRSCQRKAGKQERWPKTSPKGKHGAWPCTPPAASGQATGWKDLGVTAHVGQGQESYRQMSGLSVSRKNINEFC